MDKNLAQKMDYKDFFAPNNVLCYGVGGLAATLTPRMIRAGMNIVGMIDKNKEGFVSYQSRRLQIMSPKMAFQMYGSSALIIITIANEKIIKEVMDALVSVGFQRDNIYGYDVYSWLTIPSERCYCNYLFTTINYFVDGFKSCCISSGGMQGFQVESFDKGLSFEQQLERLGKKIAWYHEKAKQGRIPLHCQGCQFLEDRAIPEHAKLDFMNFGSHTICNLDCIYCEYGLSRKQAMGSPFYTPEQDAENYLHMIAWLRKEDLLKRRVLINFAGGELSILPVRKKFVEFARNNPEYIFSIVSNCAVYSEEFIEILKVNDHNMLTCDLDSGTPETYLLVRGFAHFDTVVEHLSIYSKYGNVCLKYIVMPGFNTSDDDFLGQIEILKKLGLNRLMLSRDCLRARDVFEQRKELFYIAKFITLLEENGMTYGFDVFAITNEEKALIERYRTQFHRIKNIQGVNA